MPYHRLTVYQKSYGLAIELHKLTLKFPGIEQYELARQLRRSSKSIPANIAEGMGKQTSKADVKRFLDMAMGSCDESRVWLDFAKDLGYLSVQDHDHYIERYKEIGKMLRGVINRYR